MDDRLYVAFINAHREGNGAAKHSCLVVDELLLDVVSLLIRLSCMVGRRCYAVLIEEASDLIGGSSLSGEQENRGEAFEGIALEQGHESLGLVLVASD